MSNTHFCCRCGNELSENARFCPWCGSRIPDFSNHVEPAAVNNMKDIDGMLQPCTQCRRQVKTGIVVQRKIWCPSCILERFKRGDRLDNRRLPFLIIMLISFPVIFLVRIYMGKLAGEGTYELNPTAWGVTAAIVFFILNGLLSRIMLPMKYWIPAEKIYDQKLDASSFLPIVKKALYEGASEDSIYRMAELRQLTRAEIEVLIRYLNT